MLKNAYLLAKIDAHTAETERNFAKKSWQLPYPSALTLLAVDAGAAGEALLAVAGGAGDV